MAHQVATSFPDSSYSTSNKPNVVTLKSDIQLLEDAHNALDTDVTAINVPVKATKTEIITGTDDAKFATALSIAELHQLPEGMMLNGKIVPSVASNNLTVALKTKAGTDPSATDPVYVMIGGTLRTITSALSRTWNAGTLYLNLGSTELAAKETDLFPKLVWNTNLSAVELIVARIPFGDLISEYTDSLTGEKGYLYSGTKPASTDVVVNIGRFAATLSAGAGYTWTVPTLLLLILSKGRFMKQGGWIM